MCGITGFISSTNVVETSDYYDAHLLIKHRGPEDEGFVGYDGNLLKLYKGNDTIRHFYDLPHINSVKYCKCLIGHRRLAIIDLSWQGHQPLVDAGGRYAMAYNGEIFNYIELREELSKEGVLFDSQTDSEVVFKAIIKWGNHAFNKFNGMWALAFFDKCKNELILSRDRFGIKPLYYAVKDGVLYFASEQKFILKFAPIRFHIDKESAKAYLKNCHINHDANTLWEEIKEILPAHFAIFKDGRITFGKYWNFCPSLRQWNDKDAIEYFGMIFEDSLKLRMRSDVEVGTLLSGGLDSTLIVCTLGKLGFIDKNKFNSFSAVFDDERFSEKKYIEDTLKLYKNIVPHFVYPRAEQVLHYLPKLLFYIEDPFRSLSVFSQFLLYERIKSVSRVKVVLNGQGADELFAGYSQDYITLFVELLARGKIGTFLREKKLHKKFRGNIGLSGMRFIILFLKALFSRQYFLKTKFSELQHFSLREYLKYDDRTSMAFSIEARTPFLDYRLVEFAFSLDYYFKIRDFENKWIERTYAGAIIPPSVRTRKDKMGFISPQEIWQKNELSLAIDICFKNIKDGIFDEYVKGLSAWRLYQKYKSGVYHNWAYVWRLFCFCWWKQCFEKTITMQ